MCLLIADHDQAERAMLVQHCEAYGGFDRVLIATSGAEALEKICSSRPEAVLMDCELIDMSGFDVLRSLDDTQRPPAIMLAADDRYAAEAFEAAAIDYLKRPITARRFELALSRIHVAAHLAPAAVVNDRMEPASSGEFRPAAPPLGFGNRLVGERARRLYFLAPDNVDYIEANSNYINIFVGEDSYIKRDSLTRLLPLLKPYGFVRISRSVIVNLQRVTFAERAGRGKLSFELASGMKVISDAGYRLDSGAALRVERSRGRLRTDLVP
jgi:two-component system LytT family response regulator